MRFITCLLIAFTMLSSNIAYASTLRVGIYEDKPFSFMGEDGKPQGFAIDVLEEVAQQENFDIEYVHDSFPRNMEKLKNSELDMLVDVSQTSSRDAFMNFTSEFLMENWGIIISRPLGNVNTIFDLEDKRIALVSSDIYGENFIKQLKLFNVPAHIIQVDTYDEILEMLSEGSADAGVLNKLAISHYKLKNMTSFRETPVIFSPVQMKFGFSKNISKDFIEDFDGALYEMKSNPYSAFYKSASTWFMPEKGRQLPYWTKIVIWSLLGIALLAGLFIAILRKKVSRTRTKLESSCKEVMELNIRLQRDYEEIKQKKELIKKLAYYDKLTGLRNKQGLYSDIRLLCKHGGEFGIAFFDIDNLKGINNALGYKGGDALLKTISQRLSLLSHRFDRLYKWDGDEFVFIVEGGSCRKKAEMLAKETVSIFKNSLPVEGTPVFVSGCMGISCFPRDSGNPDELIKKATLALNHAKEGARNGYAFYEDSLAGQAAESFLMETRLREALLSDEFEVHYQPRVEPATGKIVGLEALIRWHDADGKPVRPDMFIPLAEETGLITSIGEVVLQKACKHAQELSRMGHALPVSVNLSPKQFEDANLINILDNALTRSGLEPSLLELEITENAVLGSMEDSIHTMELIQSRGIKLLLDDFGTGYSSLNYLMSLPIDFLKIDKIFMDRLFDDSKHENIVEFIIGLAKSLGLKIVAEGIEMPEQLDYLKSKSCDEYQGYLFSKPVPYESILALLE